MNIHKKTLITVLLVAAVIGVMAIQTSNTSLFKGQTKTDQDDAGPDTTENTLPEQILKPDLAINLQAVMPEGEEVDVKAAVTIENLGPGVISGDTPFRYALYLEVDGKDSVEIFSNTDSYTFMDPGDSFSFQYPISKTIYKYPENFKLRAVIDVDKAIQEELEDNNEDEVQVLL